MDFKDILDAMRKEVNRLELSDYEVNQLIRARYQKQWFIQLNESEKLDLLEHLRKECHDF